jgi:hypothetical protein
MTPQDALCELLARLGASKGAAVLISGEELNHWPQAAIKTMKSEKLLVKARPATSVVCPGCEQECVMPVHTRPTETRNAAPFIVCDKRSDINRVGVPINRLEQWQVSANSIADLITGLLALRRPDSRDAALGRLEVGLLKGGKGSSHLVLLADGRLTLGLAGHSIALADVLTLEDIGFKLDKQTLIRLVDKPIGRAGDAESAAQRRERIKKRVQTEKQKGNRAFLKTVAETEGISVPRLKQLLQADPTRPKPKFGRSAY